MNGGHLKLWTVVWLVLLLSILVAFATGCLVEPDPDSNRPRPSLENLAHDAIAEYARALRAICEASAKRLEVGEFDNERTLRDELARDVAEARAEAWSAIDDRWAEQLTVWNSTDAARLLRAQAEGYGEAAAALDRPGSPTTSTQHGSQSDAR